MAITRRPSNQDIEQIAQAIKNVYEVLKVHEEVILKQEERIKQLESAYMEDKLLGAKDAK